jgi:hypothetical protein
VGWLRELDQKERRTMLATGGGWPLDAFDVQVYSYVIPTLDGPFRGNRHRI